MPLPPATNIVRTASVGTIGGIPWSNILHWACSTAPVDSDVREIAQQVGIGYGDLFTNFDVSVVGLTTTAEDLSLVPALPFIDVQSYTGGATSQTPASNTCILVKHHIARRYRGGHPRTYLPPSSANTLVTPNQWSTAVIAAFQTAWDDLIADVHTFVYTSGTAVDFVNVSYFTGGAPRVTPLVDSVAGSTVETQVATQRRRIGR